MSVCLKCFQPGFDVKEEKGDNDEMFFVLITAGATELSDWSNTMQVVMKEDRV